MSHSWPLLMAMAGSQSSSPWGITKVIHLTGLGKGTNKEALAEGWTPEKLSPQFNLRRKQKSDHLHSALSPKRKKPVTHRVGWEGSDHHCIEALVQGCDAFIPDQLPQHISETIRIFPRRRCGQNPTVKASRSFLT